MMGYGLLLLPSIWKLKREFSSIKSPWYVDDGAAVGKLHNMFIYFRRLCKLGPAYGYFLEENKSILITRSRDTEKVEIIGRESDGNIKIKNGFR